jgi:hypothetical protein
MAPEDGFVLSYRSRAKEALMQALIDIKVFE